MTPSGVEQQMSPALGIAAIAVNQTMTPSGVEQMPSSYPPPANCREPDDDAFGR